MPIQNFAVCVLLLLSCSTVCAQQSIDVEGERLGRAEDHATESDDHYHDDVIAFFVGLAHEGHRDNELALGVEYERRLSASYGLGFLAEYTFTDDGTWIFAFPLAWHGGPWKVYAAPGVEREDSDDEFLVRLGVEYGFELGSWEVAPQFDIDFVDSDTVYVVGLTFARGF
jgi:hypothetical protein